MLAFALDNASPCTVQRQYIGNEFFRASQADISAAVQMFNFLNLFIMLYSTLNSQITDIRCSLEELASEVNTLWCEAKGDKLSTLLSELEDCLRDTADSIGEWEDNEELEEEWEDEDEE